MLSANRSRITAGISFALSALIIVVSVLVLLNRQVIADQVTIWSFKPSEGVEAIATNVELTPRGKFVFYATQPELADRSSFNEGCPRQEANSPILGCYTFNDKIYIYNITNHRLDGIEEVTAAHETLHAVWHRQSEGERERLAELLNEAYALIDDAELAKRMEYYQRVSPDEVTNELHSILGTEVSGLSTELEQYYSQFFTRTAVLAFHGQYSSVFTGLYNRADELRTGLEDLGLSIEADSKSYTADLDQLKSDIDSFNARADSGQFDSLGQFYAERSQLVARSATLESRRITINADIANYETMIAEYEAIASELKVLDSSLDSFTVLEEAPSV